MIEVYNQAMEEFDSGDVIWSSDLWHPGLPESIAYMNYFAKKDVKLRGLIHAGSFTDTDFVRSSKTVFAYENGDASKPVFFFSSGSFISSTSFVLSFINFRKVR